MWPAVAMTSADGSCGDGDLGFQWLDMERHAIDEIANGRHGRSALS